MVMLMTINDERILARICPDRQTFLQDMTELSVSQKFISIGCNRTPNASDCSLKSGRIAFGGHNTVALWDPAVHDA
jgi:hypothetical protein